MVIQMYSQLFVGDPSASVMLNIFSQVEDDSQSNKEQRGNDNQDHREEGDQPRGEPHENSIDFEKHLLSTGKLMMEFAVILRDRGSEYQHILNGVRKNHEIQDIWEHLGMCQHMQMQLKHCLAGLRATGSHEMQKKRDEIYAARTMQEV